MVEKSTSLLSAIFFFNCWFKFPSVSLCMDYNRFVTSCTTTSLFLFLNSTDCPEKVVALFAPSHRRQHGLHNTSTKNRQTEGAIVPTSNPINPLLRSHGLHSPPQEESQHNLPTKLFFPLCWWHAITSTSIHRVPAPERRHTRLRTWACYTRRNVKWNSCGWGGDKNVVLPQRWDIYTTSTRVSGVPGHVFYTTLYTHRTCPGCYCVTSSVFSFCPSSQTLLLMALSFQPVQTKPNQDNFLSWSSGKKRGVEVRVEVEVEGVVFAATQKSADSPPPRSTPLLTKQNPDFLLHTKWGH